jgi:glycosyltransferase involved in cell wall biosynthesis
LPIVATDAGGTRNLLGPAQQAFVVDRENSRAFGKALRILLASSDDRQALAKENLDEVRRFNTPQVARMYASSLERLITPGSPS